MVRTQKDFRGDVCTKTAKGWRRIRLVSGFLCVSWGLEVGRRVLRVSQGDTDASQRCGANPECGMDSLARIFSGGHLHVVFVHGAKGDVVELELAIEGGAADA